MKHRVVLLVKWYDGGSEQNSCSRDIPLTRSNPSVLVVAYYVCMASCGKP